jgi:glycosyltransferase involved in cell wall biosynthesis
MEVLQVCPLFLPYHGGLETHVTEVSKRLARLGFSVRIYTTDPTGKLKRRQTINELKIFRFRSYTLNNVYFFAPKLYSMLKKAKDVDVLHVHGYPNFPALAAALAKAKNRKPLVFTPHYGGYDVYTLGTSILRIFAKRLYNFSIGKYIFSKADAIIIVGKFEREILKQKFNVDEAKIRYIPNGVNTARFKGLTKNDHSVKTILYVGRVEKYKGVHFLVEAFSKVKDTFPNSQLLIVGSGPYKEKLMYLTRSFRLQKSVKFLENISQDHLTKLYLSSNVFVTLPQFEGQPIALVEAMSYGLPVIATKVGAIPELIHHARTGFLLSFPPDMKTLVELIKLCLEKPEYSAKVGLEARNVILSRFSWDRTVQNLIELYEQLS